jgi:hypothetical protein
MAKVHVSLHVHACVDMHCLIMQRACKEDACGLGSRLEYLAHCEQLLASTYTCSSAVLQTGLHYQVINQLNASTWP